MSLTTLTLAYFLTEANHRAERFITRPGGSGDVRGITPPYT